jgi:hypothetical protein
MMLNAIHPGKSVQWPNSGLRIIAIMPEIKTTPTDAITDVQPGYSRRLPICDRGLSAEKFGDS